MKLEINNAERLELIKHVNREIQKASSAGGTFKRFEMLYELKDKLKVYVPHIIRF